MSSSPNPEDPNANAAVAPKSDSTEELEQKPQAQTQRPSTGGAPDPEPTFEQMEDPHDLDVKEQDRWLPIANVARIMKSALPENAKIAKEAKECMQECVSEFISFITSEASEKCQQEKRKTVNGEDILYAMTSLGFENYSETLKLHLARYREIISPPAKPGQAPGNGAMPLSSTDPNLSEPLVPTSDMPAYTATLNDVHGASARPDPKS